MEVAIWIYKVDFKTRSVAREKKLIFVVIKVNLSKKKNSNDIYT